jgi:co-chaperonin GroES (HSP10)
MKCLHNNVVIVREKSIDQEKGILLPDSAKKESKRGQIICAGPDCKDLKVGDKILVPLLTMMRVMQTARPGCEGRGRCGRLEAGRRGL